METHAIADVIGTLVDAGIKGAAVLLWIWALTMLMRRRPAAQRHALWTGALIVQLALPALVMITPAWRMPWVPGTAWITREPVAEPLIVPMTVRGDLSATPSHPSPSTQPAAQPAVQTDPVVASTPRAADSVPVTHVRVAVPNARPTFAGWLLLLYCAGALIIVARLAVGTAMVSRMARAGERVHDGQWLSLVQRLATSLGIDRPLTLLRGSRLGVPVTWGVVYPVVLLPEDADRWPEERRRYVLVHEMAHVKRFDALTQLVAQLALALFWFNPLVWIAVRRMRLEREHACDDYVLRHGTVASTYANDLLEMVRQLGTPEHRAAQPAFAALAMARRSEFEGRMLSILDPNQPRQPLSRRGTVMSTVAALLIALPLAALRPFTPATSSTTWTPPASATAPVAGDTALTPPTHALPALAAGSAMRAVVSKSSDCTTARMNAGSETSIHSDEDDDPATARISYLQSRPGHCIAIIIVGKLTLGSDDASISALSDGGRVFVHERTTSRDRTATITRDGNTPLQYRFTDNGQPTADDADMRSWLGSMLGVVSMELGIDAPARVARVRKQGGVPAVLDMISTIESSSGKRAHFAALLATPGLTDNEIAGIVTSAGTNIQSSGDLRAVLEPVIRGKMGPATRTAMAHAADHVASSGDRAALLSATLSGTTDKTTLLAMLQAADGIPSSGDLAGFLVAAVPQVLGRDDADLRQAFFNTLDHVASSGDQRDVLQAVMRTSSLPSVRLAVVNASARIASSGDQTDVLRSAIRDLHDKPTTLAALKIASGIPSSDDLASLLTSATDVALSSGDADLRTAFFAATNTIPSSGDHRAVLEAASRYATSPDVAMAILGSVRGIASSGDQSAVLVRLVASHAITTPALRSAYLATAKTISSTGDYQEAVDALESAP